MDNFSCAEKGEKGFNLEEIKKLIEQDEKDDNYKLIMRFYRELLLVSEVIDNQYEDKDIKRTMGFYFKNQDEIPYIKPLTLFKIDGKEIKFITGNKDYFYKEKNIENELYLKRGKWYVNISKEPCDKLFKIDELYFHGKKVKAKNIKVSSEPSELIKKKNNNGLINCFLNLERSKYNLRKKKKLGQEENKDSNFKKDIRNYSKQPIGIQYIYSKLQKEEPIFFLDFDEKLRSIWTLTNMEKDSLNIKTKDNIIFTTEEKLITQTFLTDNGYKSIKLEGNDILYEGKKIKKLAKKIFCKKNLNPTTNISNFDEGIIFITKRKTYRFEKTITFESSNSTNEVLTKAIAYKSKKGKLFIFESNYAEPFNTQNYQNSEYNIMLKHDSFPINKDYIVLYKEQIEEIKQYNSFYTKDDIYKKYKPNLQIGNINISIFREGTKLSKLSIQNNIILMTAPKPKTIKCNYLKILYRFRNSIAHGEFKILDDRIIFCNTHDGETLLKAQISKDDIDFFLKELRKKTLDMQL